MDYAIIKLGNKQHKVRDGETLVVDRLPAGEGKSFEPVVLLGEGKVTATVVAHERGPKIRIGKYRRRTGYKRHNGFRAATSRVQISLGAGTKPRAAAKPATTKPKAETAAPVEAAPKRAAEKVAVPAGYDDLTIADLKTALEGWSQGELEAALAHEQANAARKGAITALESALAKESD
jgi:large subunit ribosomal protein L21